MQSYTRGLASRPSLPTGTRKMAAIRRPTAIFELPDNIDSALPYLTPAIKSAAGTVAPQTGDVSHKDRRHGFDCDQKLTLAYRQILDAIPADGRRNSFLPSIHTQEREDACVDWTTSPTPSSTYSSSLYTSEFDLDFPKPPLSTDSGAYKDCPMFTQEETHQVRNFLRKRWGAIGAIDPGLPITGPRTATQKLSVAGSLPVSVSETNDPSWTGYWEGNELGDFSWEADDDSGESNNDAGTHNLLGQMGLLNDSKHGGRNISVGQSRKVDLPSRIPVPVSNVRKAVKEDLDDVSAVLSALRSSIHIEDLVEQDKGMDDDAERDKGLREEVRMRLGTKSSLIGPCKREKAIIQISSPAVAASKSLRDRNVISNGIILSTPRTPSQKPPSTLHTPQSSGDFGEARIVPRYNPGVKQIADAHRLKPSAFEQLESSVSKLQTHSPHLPHQHQRQQSESSVPPRKDKHLPISHRSLNRSSGIMKKKPIVVPLPIPRQASEPQLGPHIPAARAAPKNLRDKFHARSPSAPAWVPGSTPRSQLAPSFPVHRPYASPGELFERNIPQRAPPPRPKTTNVEGFRSFMDITPEQTPRHTHSRTRTSMVGAVFHAEKARKLLARASSSIANWGKGLARSSMKKG
jgi:hypothetical protein